MVQARQLSRRGFLARIAAGSAAALAAAPVAAAGGAPSAAERDPLQAASPALAAVLAPIVPGAGVVNGWFIGERRLEGGAVVLGLQHESGAALRVDVCRRDRQRLSGVEQTEHFELMVMNAGEGSLPTPRDHELAVRIVAEVLRRTEASLGAAPADLLCHEERVALFQRRVLHYPEIA